MDNLTLPANGATGATPATPAAAHPKEEKEKMTKPVNIFTTGDGGSGGAALPLAAMMAGGNGGFGHGAGAGAMALGGALIGSLLFGRGGFGPFGGGVVDGAVGCGSARRDCLTAEMSATQTMGLNNAIGAVADKVSSGDMMIQQALAAGFSTSGQMTLQQTIMLMQQLNLNQQTVLTELCGVNTNVSAQGCMTREAVANDGEKTRALIQSIQDANLQRQLTVAETALLDSHRRRDHDQVIATITNTNTAVAAQAQGQAQAQQQQIVEGIRALFPLVQSVLQVAHATNSNIIAGNAGAVTTGPQSANPTNVNA